MINWKPNPDCDYSYDYQAIFARMASKKDAAKTVEEIQAFEGYVNGVHRSLILNDLFFIVQFVIEIPESKE